jgi:PAS domain S-box-containing protein
MSQPRRLDFASELPPHAEARGGEAARGEGREERRARILLVDDRPENLLALEAILEPLDHELVRAGSGEEALREVLRHDFACILLDVQMPGMNGFETAQLIKSRERSRFTPIIFLTAISKEDAYVFEGYSVGAVDYLFKPFNPDVLRSKVAVFVDLYLKNEQLKDQEQRLRESERRELELRHRAELQVSEARLGEIVGSAMEAIITFGADRRITLFNAAAERMFGVPRETALGQEIDALFDPALRGEEMVRICADAARASRARAGDGSPAPRSLSLTGVRAGGSAFPAEASVSCLELEGERVFTVIARDVSERKRQEEALRQQAVSLARATADLQSVNEQLQARQLELENAMSARSRFYASMSHELRTPINAILGYSSLLLDNIYGPLTPEQARGIERANKAAKHLLELVNDILDLSKIEAGKIELEIQPTAFPAIIQDLFVTVRPMADEHGSELSLRCEDAGPVDAPQGGARTVGWVSVITDPRRVRQILLNLLSNAIKFGEGKPIDVTCRALADGGVQVEVRDHGPGIAPDDVEKIFDEFVQLSQPNQHQGTGLGLPISRRLAKLLDGDLEVESVPGEGSTFRLLLPARVTEARFNAETAQFITAAPASPSPADLPPPDAPLSAAAAELPSAASDAVPSDAPSDADSADALLDASPDAPTDTPAEPTASTEESTEVSSESSEALAESTEASEPTDTSSDATPEESASEDESRSAEEAPAASADASSEEVPDASADASPEEAPDATSEESPDTASDDGGGSGESASAPAAEGSDAAEGSANGGEREDDGAEEEQSEPAVRGWGRG